MSSFDDYIQPNVTIIIEKPGEDFILERRDPETSKNKSIQMPMNKDEVQIKIIRLRDELSKWASRYEDLLLSNSTDRVRCDPLKIRDMWTSLAKKGRELYRVFFDLNYQREEKLVMLAQDLRSLKAGSIIEIDALPAPLPWAFLYEGDIPPIDDPKYLKKLIPQFWGIRYQLAVYPPWGYSTVGRSPRLPNKDGTRLTVAINQKKDEEYKTGQMSFFTDMKEKFRGRQGAGGLAIGTCKQHVIDNLQTREEPQHLFYFYCHHEKGDGEMTIYGTHDLFQQTQIVMEGDEQGVITLDELEELSNSSAIQPFKSRPVIFLNACQSGKLKMGDPTSFVTYFIRRLDSWNFMGTEADIPAPFADAFGKAFVSSFLTGQGVGEILFRLRNKFAQKHLNPFGLYYTLFGRGDIRLQRRVKGIA